jgi:hypothetical protein
MIIGGVAAGVRILLEKGPSWDHILKIRKILEKYPEIIFSQKTQEARRRSREEPGGPTRQGGAASTLAARGLREAALAHPWSRPFTYIIVPENLSQGGLRVRHSRLCGAENTEREKLSGREKSAGEIPSRRGEIIAIVITIAPDFIGIIIIIISITSTFISTITTPFRCNILSWILLYS